jgi:tetratricopeptide (TPR) repeat protein
MELENAIALDQKFAEAHAELGVQYALLGRYQEAEAELRRTIELIPDDSIPYSNLAWVELRLGKVAEVEQSLRQIIRRSPENATAYMMLGSLLSGAPETLAEGTRYLEYAARTIPDAKLILKKLDGKVAVLTYPVLP